MKSLNDTISSAILRLIDRTPNIRRAAASRPLQRIALATPPSAAFYSVARWDVLSEAFGLQHPLVEVEQMAEASFDIRSIEGLAQSKSDLGSFTDLDAMAVGACAAQLQETTPAALEQLLRHSQVRVGRAPGEWARGDAFIQFGWDRRVFLANSGGSHHFAAARYLAGKLGVDVPLYAPLQSHRLSALGVSELQRNWRVFALHRDDELPIAAALERDKVQFRTIVPSHWAFPHDIPAALVMLPVADPRTREVAGILQAAGVTDLTDALSAALWRQGELDAQRRQQLAAEEAAEWMPRPRG